MVASPGVELDAPTYEGSNTEPAEGSISTNSTLPHKIGRYTVLGHLGAGAMGVVYSAFDDELSRRVAIKVLKRTGAGAQARLRREARSMAKLAHPNVAAIYEIGVWEERTYIALEYVEGCTLREWLGQRPRAAGAVLDVMKQAGHALAVAHEAGLIHRDFKPDNVMVGTDGRVRVLDFGLARVADGLRVESIPSRRTEAIDTTLADSLTRTGALVGTPAYMAPEQFGASPITAKSDQFSFCVATYEALYGERPFEGKTLPSLAMNVVQGKLREGREERRGEIYIEE